MKTWSAWLDSPIKPLPPPRLARQCIATSGPGDERVMSSLDVAQWRRRRSEVDGARSKYRAASPLPRVDQHDRRTKHIYGKNTCVLPSDPCA